MRNHRMVSILKQCLTAALRPSPFGLSSGLFFLLLVSVQAAGAASVTVQAQLSTTSIYLGDSVQLELRINGLRDPELPDFAHPDIDITSEGGQSFNNSSITIVNGRISRVEKFGYVARYRLRPRATGALHIPAIAITHKGQTYYSQSLRLVVKQPAEQDYLLVEVYTDKPYYVLGETITITLELSLRKLTLDGDELEVDPFFQKQPPHLRIPWFESLGDWKTTDLQTFAQPFLGQQRPGFFINDYSDQRSFFGRDKLTFTLPRQSTRHKGPTGTFNYFTYRLHKEFRPIRTAVQTISPVLVKATLPTLIDARGRARRTEKFVASSQSLTVEVRPVPRVGQPVSFSGGVGHFRLEVDATPTKLKVGDPLTLTVSVHGEEDSLLETVRPPRLQDQPALARDFKIHTDPPAVQSEQNTKTFTYTLRPRHASIRAVPPIDMAYYAPDTGRFHVLQSHPIPLRVEGASTLEAADIIVASTDRPKSRLGKQLAEGLLANYTGTEVLAPQHAELRITPLMLGLLVLPPVVYIVTLLSRQWVRQRRQYPGRQRSRKAARTALTTLNELRNQQETNDTSVCEGIHQALTGYISDKLDLTGAGLTVADVTQHLKTHRLEQNLIDRAEALFHLCDSARYAPGTLAVVQLTGLIEDAEALVQQLETSAQL